MKNLNEFFNSKIRVFFIYTLLSLIYFYDPLITGKLLAGSDYLLGGYVAREWLSNYLKNFYLPLWFPYERAGYPILEAFWMDIFTPTGLLRFFLPTHIHFNFSFFFYTVLAGFGTYLFLKELKIKSLFAFIAGVFYSFSGILITNTSAGHLNRLVSSSLLPLVMYFLLLGVERKRLLFFILAGYFAGWQFLGGQFQFTYFSFFLYIPFFFFLLFTRKLKLIDKLKLTFYALIGIIFTILLYSPYILPVIQNLKALARGAGRGYEYAASWPLFPLETFDIIFINFTGFLETYWGPNFFRLNHYYIGLFPFMLFIFAFFSKDKKNLIFFFVIFLITLTFSWGNYFITHKIFYYIVPGISKFRGPSNIFFLTTFCLVTLSAIGLSYLSENFNDKRVKYFFLIFLILFILFLVFFSSLRNLFRDIINNYPLERGEINQKLFAFDKAMSLFVRNIYILIFELIFVYIIFYVIKINLEKEVLFLIFPLITFFEVFIFLRPKFLKSTELKEYIQKDEVINFLEKDKGFFRVFYLPNFYEHDNDGILTIYGIEDAGGYVGNPLKRYQDFIGAGESVMFNPQNLIKNRNLLNLINIKYIILPIFPMDTTILRGREKSIVKFLLDYTKDMELIFKGKKYYIFENKKDFGRFYLRNKFYVANSPEEALSLIIEKNYADSFAVIEKNFLPKNYRDFESTPVFLKSLEIIEKKPDLYRIKINISKNSILIFSMNYHKGWNAYIDGEKKEVFPLNYGFIGLLVPEGEHEIVFKFGSKFHYIGIFLNLLFTFLVVLLLALFIFKR
ncbi:MAG: YfhO family protein [candidate division WOR-3 bacterium]